MELVDRYISAVQRYLPEDKRNDIGRELKAHLLDQLDSQQDELGRTLTDDEVADIRRYIAQQRKEGKL